MLSASAVAVLGDAGGLAHPEPGRLGGAGHPAHAMALMRVLVAAGLQEMGTRGLGQRLEAAKLHRGEAPGPGREIGLGMIGAGRADEVRLRHRGAAQIDLAAHRGPHALGPPGLEVDPDPGLVEVEENEAQPAVGVGGRDERALHMVDAGREGLGTLQPQALRRPLQRQAGRPLGVPDPRQLPGIQLIGEALALRSAAVAVDEADGVDMALIEPADGQVAPAEKAQHLEKRRRTVGLGAEAETTLGGRQGSREQADLGQGRHIGCGESGLPVERRRAFGHLADQELDGGHHLPPASVDIAGTAAQSADRVGHRS